MSDSENGPAEPDDNEPTTPFEPQAPQPPQAPLPPPGYQPPPPYAGAQPATPQLRPPTWMWPLVCVLALVIGVLGGVIGGAIVNNGNSNDTSSGSTVLKVESGGIPPLPAGNASIPAVAAKVLPSTVQIVAEYKGVKRGATGSGFVLDRDGHIITNNHVVADAVAEKGPIEVIDQSGRHLGATVVGRSLVYDVAVLKVSGAENLKPVSLGSANQLRVGQTVVAFGSPLGLSATVTSGIISAKRRPVTTGDGGDASFISALQTDAAINPGNSGGPLVNLEGQVIGMNSAIASLGTSGSSDESANIGVGFAIPVEQVLVTADQILRTGKAQYPVMGATVGGTAAGNGAVVKGIDPGTPAASSDLRKGDLITDVDGLPVTGQIDVVVAIRTHQAGEKVDLTVIRGKKTLHIKVGLIAKTG